MTEQEQNGEVENKGNVSTPKQIFGEITASEDNRGNMVIPTLVNKSTVRTGRTNILVRSQASIYVATYSIVLIALIVLML